MPNGKVHVWCTNKPAELARAKAAVKARWPKNTVEFFNPAHYDAPPDGKRFAQQIVAVVVLCTHPPEIISDHRREGFDVLDLRDPNEGNPEVESTAFALVWLEQDQTVQDRLRDLARQEFPGLGIVTLPAASWPTDKAAQYDTANLRGVVCAGPRWRIAQDYRSRGFTVVTLDANSGGTEVPMEVKASMGDTADPGVLDALLTLDEESFVAVVGTQASVGFLKALANREKEAANRMVFQAAIQARMADLGSSNPVYVDHVRGLEAAQAARYEEVEGGEEAGDEGAGEAHGQADDAEGAEGDAGRGPEAPGVETQEQVEAKLKALSFQQGATVLGVARKLPRAQIEFLLKAEKAGPQRLTVLRSLNAMLARK